MKHSMFSFLSKFFGWSIDSSINEPVNESADKVKILAQKLFELGFYPQKPEAIRTGKPKEFIIGCNFSSYEQLSKISFLRDREELKSPSYWESPNRPEPPEGLAENDLMIPQLIFGFNEQNHLEIKFEIYLDYGERMDTPFHEEISEDQLISMLHELKEHQISLYEA